LQGSPDRVPVVPIGGHGREPLLVAALIVLGVAIALLKPWGRDAATQPGLAFQPANPAPIVGPAIVPMPTAAPADGANRACDYGPAWRLLTVARNAGRLVETWYSTDPVHARGPDDPSIPVVRMYTEGLQELGYCAVTVPAGPRPVLTTEAWRLSPGASPERIPLVRTGRFAPADPDVGALYAAPASPEGTAGLAWPQGRYVLVVRYGTQPLDGDWFSVAVIQLPGSPLPIP
jgi:hypothetical protein